jgi:hypothetical protein
MVLLKEMSLDYNTVINACLYGLSGGFAAGVFGFFIGKILETSGSSYNKQKKSAKKYSDIAETEK